MKAQARTSSMTSNSMTAGTMARRIIHDDPSEGAAAIIKTAIIETPRVKNDNGKDAKADRGQVVQSLCRALNILTILGSNDGPMTLTELSEAANLSPSTTHRLLTTLQYERYVRFDQSARGWVVGVQAYMTGANFLKTRNLVDVARPRMRRLMEESSEIVNLAVEENGEALYLARVGGPRAAQVAVPQTDRTLLHCSAVGKALLAGMPETKVQTIVTQRGMRQFTRSTLSSLPALYRDLTLVRTRGYALDQEERVSGLRCVAAPIFDENSRVMGALSLSGSSRRIEDARLRALGEMVKRAAAAVTQELGGRVPVPN
ncbi:IclR family transcriptional regulator (plasmid) [Azospirillum oryzae]|uniref:IclR family transcriptional regulator n=1 Tax=Azospirillum oryzae TaxID=286727 RepID=A0A6N1AQU0_9PROT|nr:MULTISPECIES: IclR family transcriptional regulator [Azospirillum]KAA0570732.1 IclR family transcriptional regulator [Azospirillum sp. Sh1]KAA0586951.1 IclR family transcriptional regulator [Azospirillum oryzae]QKS54185.1 IclR family transcriptional regulator [Azospirillum oryzae]GLR80162.1 IclR family transcriptional regulator [Azospirillum oryzae]